MTPSGSSSHEDRVNLVIVEYLQALERGEKPDPENYLILHPEIAEELKSFFGNREQFQQVINAPTITPGASTSRFSFEADQNTLQFPLQGNLSSRQAVQYFGDYELLHEIARGGMGVVYKARQINLNRMVALKMILAGQFAGPQDVQRFYTEAEAAAQLDHPGIVPIFEVGQHEGQHFFSMGFVEGRSLAARVAEGPLPAREAAELVRDVALAVQYAHDQGVIHRDLKPGNILLDASGKSRVTDFGLAKLTKSGSDLTGTGQILGTPSYMPPEQASGKLDQTGPPADIYALGAVLYCLLAGRPPFQASSSMDTLLQVLEQEPVPPRQLNPNIPLDLDTIVLKCLDKSPSRRYASALALADELNRYLEGRPILARRVSRAERFWRWCRREPVVSSLSVALLVASLIGTAVSSCSLLQEYRVKEELRRDLYVADLQLADQIWESGNGTAKQVADLLAGHIPVQGQSDLREFAWRSLWTSLNQNSLVLKGNGSCPRIAAFAADGRLVTLDEELVLRRWKLPEGTALPELKLKPGLNVSCWAISADARRVGLGSVNHVYLIDTETGEVVRQFTWPALVLALSLSSDGRQLAAAWGDGCVQTWDTDGDSEPASCFLKDVTQAASIDRIELSPDRNGLFLLDYPKVSQVTYLTGDSQELLCPTEHKSGVYSAAFSSDGNWRATGDANGTVCLSEVASRGENDFSLRVHRGTVSALGFSSDGHWLATGGVDGVVTIWDVELRKKVHTFKGHFGRIYSLCFAKDHSTVASASEDGTTRVWNLNEEGSSIVFGTHSQPVFSVAYSRDGRRLAVGTGAEETGGVVKIWDVPSGQLVTSFWAAEERVLALAFSRDGKRLLTGGYDSQLRAWNPETGKPLTELRYLCDPPKGFRKSEIGTLAVSPDGNQVVAGFGHPTFHQSDYAQIVSVWDVATGKLIKTLKEHTNTVCEVAYSRDGKLLATASDDRRVILWSTETWTVVRTLPGADRLKSVTFSVDGLKVVAGDSRGTVTIWETSSGRLLNQLRGHSDAVQRVAFCPDGRTLATASWDNSIKLWDPVSGRETQTLIDHKDWISCLAFSPDGNSLVSGSFDATIRLKKAAAFTDIAAVLKQEHAMTELVELRRRHQLHERTTRKTRPLTKVELLACSGIYHDGLTIETEGDHLTTHPIEGHAGKVVHLYPKSENEFFARECNLDVTFLKDKEGQVARVVICLNGIAHEAHRTNTPNSPDRSR